MKQGTFDKSKINKEVSRSRHQHAGTLVRITEYNPSKHLLKVVKAKNGEPLEKDGKVDYEVVQNKPFEQREARVLKVSDLETGPIIEVTNDTASLRGSSDSGFYSTEKFGNIIKGPLSIEASPQDIKISGINTLNPLISSGIPSTIVTPIPVCLFDFPGAKAVGPIMKDVATMAVLVAAMGV